MKRLHISFGKAFAVGTLVVLLNLAALLLADWYNDVSSRIEQGGKEHYGRRPWYPGPGDEIDLSGKVALVTGSSSGIGRAIVTDLYRRGCAVIVTSRSQRSAERAIQEIEKEVGTDIPNGRGTTGAGSLHGYALELSDFTSVRSFAEKVLATHSRLDFLSTNAGVASVKGMSPMSPDGYEVLYASNYLGHFLLIQKLLPLLNQSRGRIVATSSIMEWVHDDDLEVLLPVRNFNRSNYPHWWRPNLQYANTKMAQILMCFEFQRRHPSVGCTPVDPGYVKTHIWLPNFVRTHLGFDAVNRASDLVNWFQWFATDAKDGAKTTLHALLHPEDGATDLSHQFLLQPYYTPLYFDALAAPSRIVSKFTPVYALAAPITWGLHKWRPHPDAYNEAFAAKLWEQSLEACGLVQAQ